MASVVAVAVAPSAWRSSSPDPPVIGLDVSLSVVIGRSLLERDTHIVMVTSWLSMSLESMSRIWGRI